jgi:hypothetical protein
VFVALEIRQNTNAVRSATIQAISEQSYESLALFVENADLRAALIAERNGRLSDDQRLQLRSFWAAELRAQQNRFLQIELGILDEEIARQIQDAGQGGSGYRSVSFRKHWAELKHNYPADFQEYVEQYIPSVDRLQSDQDNVAN